MRNNTDYFEYIRYEKNNKVEIDKKEEYATNYRGYCSAILQSIASPKIFKLVQDLLSSGLHVDMVASDDIIVDIEGFIRYLNANDLNDEQIFNIIFHSLESLKQKIPANHRYRNGRIMELNLDYIKKVKQKFEKLLDSNEI